MTNLGFKVWERPHGIMFTDAEVTLVCRKLYKQSIDIKNLPKSIVKKFYHVHEEEKEEEENLDHDFHEMYIGEVVEKLFRSKDEDENEDKNEDENENENEDEDCDNDDDNDSFIFKEGCGTASNSVHWKVCYDELNDQYTASLGYFGAGGGAINLYEITKEIFDKVGTFEEDDHKSSSLIQTGRHLFEAVNDHCGPPYHILYDENYKKLCPWIKLKINKDSKAVEAYKKINQ